MEVLQRLHNRGSISTGEYQIDNSVKMEQDNTERMYKSWGSGSGDRRTWTISCWVKRTELGDLQYMWGAGTGGLDFLGLSFDADDTLRFRHYTSAEYCIKKTNRLFRDISAWYHIVVAVDTTDGTAGNRQKIYINGIEETSFQTSTDFDQNRETPHNQASGYFEVGTMIGSADRFNGYISELYSISGLQLAPTDFGKFDDNGVWIPIDYAGSYPGNSVRLEFKNASSMGDDTGGNHNSQPLTLQNIDASDQATDTPTNNFATINPLFKYPGSQVIKEGATKVTRTSGSGLNKTFLSTIGVNGGKWYAEFKPTASSNYVVGIIPESTHNTVAFDGNYIGNSAFPSSIGYYSDTGQKIIAPNGGSDYGGSYTTNDIISIALDMDNYRVQFHKNGVVQALSAYIDLTLDETTFIAFSYDSSGEMEVNFGGYHVNSLSSVATDENGYGSFEYAPPSGYLALCTKNLASTGG